MNFFVLALSNPLHPLEDVLQSLLEAIQETTNLPWAWCIIVLTALVRIAILPVTVKQTRSMLAMQKLQPYVKQIQQKYKGDRQALNTALMEFYKDNKVNPLASCLPLVLQIPVFISLFFVLKNYHFTGDVSFLFGFVDDITNHINASGAAGWILLSFYAISQITSSAVMVTSPDPMQRRMMMFLPLAFLPFLLKFPVGVMLYWITTNLWTLGQYLVVVKLLPDKREVRPPGKGGDSGGNKAVRPGNDPKSDSGGAVKVAPRRNKRRR
jgi:YidC/Oxa1 family membrane protein insertase